MIFVSAGHAAKSIKNTDPGAVNAQGIKEGDLTIDFRDLITGELCKLGVPYKTDNDEESLSQYLQRIQTGNGSVVVEYHFDSSSSSLATGTTGIIEQEADRLDKAFAKELTDATSRILGVRNRGVITEAESHRGRLGLMREDGIICLCELGFITNLTDLQRYHTNKGQLAKVHAEIIRRYENLIV